MSIGDDKLSYCGKSPFENHPGADCLHILLHLFQFNPTAAAGRGDVGSSVNLIREMAFGE
jgi:hypothetical protein